MQCMPLHNPNIRQNGAIMSISTLLFVLKTKFSFHFVSFICRFFESETPLNYSTFDQLDFVKSQDFDSNYVVVM